MNNSINSLPIDSDLYNSLFMKAVRCEPTHRPPVWLMRQAGRYMAEYRRVRERVSFLELCHNPTLCANVMCEAVGILGVDAAILFSDLLVVLPPMGFDLTFSAGDGPVIHNPICSPEDVKRIKEPSDDMRELDYVFEAVGCTRGMLPRDLPLIGFAGAPFTLASYLIEGGSSRSFTRTKQFMYQHPEAFDDLMTRLVDVIRRYLIRQLQSGAQVVQMFDSWVGCLSPEDYSRYVQYHSSGVLNAVSLYGPTIHFGTGNPSLIPAMTQAGGDVIGIDWRINLAEAWDIIDANSGGNRRAVMGNLDPAVLLTSHVNIHSQTRTLLESVEGRPGYIFNLGHGILKETPVENVKALIDFVRL